MPEPRKKNIYYEFSSKLIEDCKGTLENFKKEISKELV